MAGEGLLGGKLVTGIQKTASVLRKGLTIAEPSRLPPFGGKRSVSLRKQKRTYVSLPPPPISTTSLVVCCVVFFFSFLNFSLSSLITSPRTRRALPGPRRRALGSEAAAGPQVRAGGTEGAAQGGAGGEKTPRSGEGELFVCVVARACQFGFFPPKSMQPEKHTYTW